MATATPDPLELAQRLAAGDLAPEVLPWLQAGMRRYLAGLAPLDVALRLTGAARMLARNRALIAAAGILDDGQGLPTWELAGLLEAAVRRFEGDRLVQINRGLDPRLTELEQCLLRANRSGARPMRSRRRLYDLLTIAR